MHKRQKLLYERQQANQLELSRIMHLACYNIIETILLTLKTFYAKTHRV